MKKFINVVRTLILICYYPIVYLIMLNSVAIFALTAYLAITEMGSNEYKDAVVTSVMLFALLLILFVVTLRPFIVTFEALLLFGLKGFPLLLGFIVGGIVFLEVKLLYVIIPNFPVNTFTMILLLIVTCVQAYFLMFPYFKLISRYKPYKERFPNDKSVFTIFRNRF